MIADVADNPGDASLLQTRQSSNGLVNLTPLARADADIHTLAHQRFRNGPADALRSARYDCDFALRSIVLECGVALRLTALQRLR